MDKLKAYLLGALGGAVPAVFLWIFGAPVHIVLGALIFGVIIGEIIGVAIGEDGRH